MVHVKTPDFTFVLGYKGTHLYDTLADTFQETLLYLVCWNEASHSAAGNGLSRQFQNKIQTTYTFRTYIGALFACVVKPSTLNQHKLSARSYKRSEWPFFFALFGCSSPCMGAVHGQRGMQGIQWQSCQSEGFSLSKLCLSVKRKHYVQTSQRLFIHGKPQVHRISHSQHPLCNACPCYVCTIAA